MANLLNERGKLQNFAIYMVSAIVDVKGVCTVCVFVCVCACEYVWGA